MDGRLNNIATPLILLFLLIFLFLLAQILHVLYLRRRLQRLGSGEPNQKSFFLFWRNQSRIQPKEIPSISKTDADSEGAAVVVVVETWQQLCGPSRTLFTIKEEEEREGIIECFTCNNNPFPKLKTDENTIPFHTPCASPPFSAIQITTH